MTKRITILATAVVAVLVAAAVATGRSTDTTITGAGSTFVQPLVAAWTPALGKAFGYGVQYSGVGSGAGIAAITANQVDFGASDAPLSPAQKSACPDCVQIPWALSATAVAYNVPGAPAHLRLDGNTISKIFLGRITSWNDPAIRALNRGASLPNLKITPIFRSDGSGTSYNFTDYLSSVSAQWKREVGASTSPAFPAGQGAKGSSGVAGLIARTDGAIGYVDVAYAIRNHITFAAVRNRAGKFLFPSLRRIQAAAVAFPKVPADNAISIVDPPRSAKLAYPVSTYTYVIVHKKAEHAAELRKLIFWALTQGQQPQFAAKLTFAPMSTVKSVLVAAEKTLKQVRPAS
ncbi:MAG TPA: phosphate ABC transporter substrate-binding protein PstS [Gaiellaceae bacterium]|jgi:phosphate transport system substrate-binding protein|nr:phosphate ABC transporter substrate-binding protein PstS [Gaiellaceae bacterium]